MNSSSSNPKPMASLTSGDGSGKKVRKPYTITKSRESWTEEEHDKFLEALQLYFLHPYSFSFIRLVLEKMPQNRWFINLWIFLVFLFSLSTKELNTRGCLFTLLKPDEFPRVGFLVGQFLQLILIHLHMFVSLFTFFLLILSFLLCFAAYALDSLVTGNEKLTSIRKQELITYHDTF